jgi:magnesium transporter
MPFQAYYLDATGEFHKDLNEEAVQAAYASGQGLLWVDISETTEEDGRFLERVFSFHPVAIEACVETEINTSTIYDFNQYLFLILHGINYRVESDILQTTELAIFIGPHYLVSNHNFFLYSVEAVRKLAEADGRPLRRGVDFLAHALIDALVSNIIPTIDRLSDRSDDIEDVIFQHAHPSTLEAILQVKRSSLRLRRAMAPQRLALNQLARGDFALISPEAMIYYRDIYDEMVRIESSIENLRERIDTILTTHMSAIANQQNETMKILSLIAAIFMPLTLLAGIYSMNFDYMPELRFQYSYFIVLGVMVTVAGGVVWWFWARKWLAAGRKRLERFVPTAVDPERLIDYPGKLISYMEHMAGRLHL